MTRKNKTDIYGVFLEASPEGAVIIDGKRFDDSWYHFDNGIRDSDTGRRMLAMAVQHAHLDRIAVIATEGLERIYAGPFPSPSIVGVIESFVRKAQTRAN